MRQACRRCVQVLFQDGKFQWKRLENLIALAREGSGGLDLSDTVRDGEHLLQGKGGISARSAHCWPYVLGTLMTRLESCAAGPVTCCKPVC
jgi:hypothetical protein